MWEKKHINSTRPAFCWWIKHFIVKKKICSIATVWLRIVQNVKIRFHAAIRNLIVLVYASFVDLDDYQVIWHYAKFLHFVTTLFRLCEDLMPAVDTHRMFYPHIAVSHVRLSNSWDSLDKNRHQDSNEWCRPLCDNASEKLALTAHSCPALWQTL